MSAVYRDYDGYTELVFTERNGRTVASTRTACGQSRLSSSLQLNDEPTTCYFLITMGGGLIEGEHYETKITSESNTHAIVSTQAPTYVYKCEGGRTTENNFDITVEANAALEFMSDDVIPYGDSIYKQVTTVNVARGGSLLLTDGVGAGWALNREDFQYTFVHLLTHIYYDGQLLYNDNLILDPKRYDMPHLGLFDGFRNFSSFIVVDERIDEHFCSELQEEATRLNEYTVGVTQLEGPGVVVRVLGNGLNENKAVLLRFIDIVRKKLYDLPHLDLRKDVSFRTL